MEVKSAITLCIMTVTITVAVQNYFKSAKEADFQAAALKEEIDSSKQEILTEMTIRREARDKEISGLRETMLLYHGSVMEQLKVIGDRVSDLQHDHSSEASFDRSGSGDGS